MITDHNQKKKKTKLFEKIPNQESGRPTSHNSTIFFLTKILGNQNFSFVGIFLQVKNRCPNAYLALTIVEIERRKKKWREEEKRRKKRLVRVL